MNNAHFEVRYDDGILKQTYHRIEYKALVELFPHLKMAVQTLEKPGYRFEDHHNVIKITRLVSE